MLSLHHARPQQSTQRAYVCLSCRLNTPRRHFASTASSRSNHPITTDTPSGSAVAPGSSGTVPPSSDGEVCAENGLSQPSASEVTSSQSGRPQSHRLVRAQYTRDLPKAPKDVPNVKSELTLTFDPNARKPNSEERFEALLKQHTDGQESGLRHGATGGEAKQALGADKSIVRRIVGVPASTSTPATAQKHWARASHFANPRKPLIARPTAQDVSRKNIRAYHKQTVAPTAEYGNLPPPEAPNGLRAQLRRWQEDHGKGMEELYKNELPVEEEYDADTSNNLTRLGDMDSLRRRTDDREDEHQAIAHFARSQSENYEDDTTDPRFLWMGDLVELEFANSEKESMLAVFIQRIGPQCQFYTMNGRWLHLPERNVQYSIPGWVSPKLVEPILAYLPDEKQIENLEALMQDAYVNDLSVPRHAAAPLVSRMMAFNRESLEIYRKHASTLDRAHDILAHKHDLRYGSLVTAATTLLKTPSDKLPLTALFTVRKALMHAGFAFNIDRRSHRLTGYIQIRSQEQVRMVEQVRGWLREWQDDLAATSVMSKKQRERHVPNQGAARVSRFIELAKTIVTASRKTREPTLLGNIGPSKVRREINGKQEAVKLHADTQFNEADQELVRFLEAWSCSNMFVGLPRIAALPPLILQATGLYDDHELNVPTGYLFLQELGTILPYENRVRFDQHLLLPSSQHSKPLQNLMENLITMAQKPNFSDAMRDLRHDWGDLPVYCIDGASAQEIDDGLSVERANHIDSQNPEWWVHIHIANPTAFFDRDHPLAKMSRHMGETIYTPERTYMMLPRWATQRHFSLAKDRPCLTFSAKLNEHGEVLENKIRSGYIKNVHRLTPEETHQLVGLQQSPQQAAVDITVGGTPPPDKKRVSVIYQMKQNNIDDLRTLQKLAEKRAELRKASGGVFFDSHKPEMSVWQSSSRPGLAWDHPHRRGSRTVEGDPVINMKTRGLQNWFAAGDGVSDILVREMMLLACNVSTQWCADRQIPTIYRGSVPKPGQIDPEKFYQDVCKPAIEKNNGQMPMHIGIDYIKTQGSVILSTKPLRHNLLGLDHYGKVTSPLRRYGDMILHWQIEAALRQEAQTGKSLLSSGPSLSGVEPDRSFLPFSSQSLQTIMLGLQPREGMITRAKSYADHFWIAMLMFRAHHFGEAKLPFETCHAFVAAKPWQTQGTILSIFEELSATCEMMRPEKMGTGLPEAQAGDRWECTLEEVNVFSRAIRLKPIRLVSRWE
jgi:hypothetical protein